MNAIYLAMNTSDTIIKTNIEWTICEIPDLQIISDKKRK